MRDSIEDFQIASPKRGAKYQTPRLRFELLAISGSSIWSGQDICRYLGAISGVLSVRQVRERLWGQRGKFFCEWGNFLTAGVGLVSF